MKINRRDLKQIVKECLIEILSEGLGPGAVYQQMGGRPPSVSNVPSNIMTSSRRVAEAVSYGNASPPEPVRQAVKELSAAKPDLASIFEDTARHTLQAQAQAERGNMSMAAMRGDFATRVADAASPDQLFGEEAAGKWAELAFMPSSKKL